jgi:non-specific serine/threonine protein kinase
MRLVGALAWFWYISGHLTEGYRWAEQTLAAAHGSPPSPTLAKAWDTFGHMSNLTGDFDASISRFTIAAAMAREVGAPLLLAHSLPPLGFARIYGHGDFAQGKASLEEGLAMCRRLDDKWGAAAALNVLGHVSLLEGNYKDARSLFEESIALNRAVGDEYGAAGALKHLALVVVAEGQALRAVEMVRETMPLWQKSGYATELIWSAEILAVAYAALGWSERAVRILGASDARRISLGYKVWPAARPARQQLLAELAAALGEARFDALWSEGQALSLEQALAEQD